MQYSKQPLSIEDQLKRLISKGIIINDKDESLRILRTVCYYRFSAYLHHWRVPSSNPSEYLPTTYFSSVYDLYNFDRNLRLIVFGTLEKIEIGIRTIIINEMAVSQNNSHWQMESNLFANTIGFQKLQQAFEDGYRQSLNQEMFLQHYQAKYSNPTQPPSWIIFEVLTMGKISLLFKSLKNTYKSQIAQHFKLHHRVLESWLHAISYVRNLCAHHSRLWNRDLSIQPSQPRNAPGFPWINPAYNNNRRLYYTLAILRYFLNVIEPGNEFTQQLKDLLAAHPNVPARLMGFPPNWDAEPVWQ